MIRARVVSALVALTGVPSMAQAPQVPLFAFVSPDAAAAWQAVNDGVMGGVSDGRFRITERQTMEFQRGGPQTAKHARRRRPPR